MKFQTILAVTAAVVGIAAAAVAADDPIAARKALMKHNGAEAKIGASIVKGETPFDVAKAKAVFAAYADAAAKMPALFPANSKTGGETTAAPAIWEKPADFKAAFAKFEADAKAAHAATTDLASFKAQWAVVMKNCGSCHETFRVKKG